MGETRIAMWSGPRNISTALMRSFGNRPDTFVTDEPLYGHFLKKTGIQHPGREEIIQSQNTDWKKITGELCGTIPTNKSVWYQKHMVHHITGNMNFEWTKYLTNCFLIRHPRDVITSYKKKYTITSAAQLGYPQQKRLYDWMCLKRIKKPPIIEANDIVKDPKQVLCFLCSELNIEFYESMLSWEPGPRDTDGVWSKYWYENVNRSSGFMPLKTTSKEIPNELESIYSECLETYSYFYDRKEFNAVIS